MLEGRMATGIEWEQNISEQDERLWGESYPNGHYYFALLFLCIIYSIICYKLGSGDRWVANECSWKFILRTEILDFLFADIEFQGTYFASVGYLPSIFVSGQ